MNLSRWFISGLQKRHNFRRIPPNWLRRSSFFLSKYDFDTVTDAAWKSNTFFYPWLQQGAISDRVLIWCLKSSFGEQIFCLHHISVFTLAHQPHSPLFCLSGCLDNTKKTFDPLLDTAAFLYYLVCLPAPHSVVRKFTLPIKKQPPLQIWVKNNLSIAPEVKGAASK